jgi:hypothetical protein
MPRAHQRDSPSHIVKVLRYDELAVDMRAFDTARMAPSYQLAAAQAEFAQLRLLEPELEAAEYLQRIAGDAVEAGGAGAGGAAAVGPAGAAADAVGLALALESLAALVPHKGKKAKAPGVPEAAAAMGACARQLQVLFVGVRAGIDAVAESA